MKKNEIKAYAIAEYHRWLAAISASGDAEALDELLALGENEEEQIDAFCGDLRFGTSGIRGILGIGTNRMNEYVVRRATQGVANYLNRQKPGSSVVISYDSRQKSKTFAMETAKVLRGNDIRVFLFSSMAPVSVLSYAIKALGCDMGIMITASHNPKIFNGYKVYNREGYQIVGDVPEAILREIDQLDFFDGIRSASEGIEPVSEEISADFISAVVSMSTVSPEEKAALNQLSVVYTPLNGTGSRYVQAVLSGVGFHNLTMVPCQSEPDENFTTCPAPNPEKITAYNEGFKILDQVHGDMIIATDPDCDRLGVCIPHDGMKVLLTGNQLGILMLDYLCRKRPPKPGQFMVKSIVTTPLAEKIADRYGLETRNTLTGFKYIGEIITNLAEEGRETAYYFGFEESNGYLLSPFIRDKDGVSAAMLAVEMAAWHKAHGRDLLQRLHQIYQEYGSCKDRTRNYFFDGPYGKLDMDSVMDYFRTQINPGDLLGGEEILEKTDYMGETDLPKSNVIAYTLASGTSLIVRPSGTEAKIKVYLFEAKPAAALEEAIKSMIQSFKAG